MDLTTLKLAQRYYDKRDQERKSLYDDVRALYEEIKQAYESGELHGKGLEIRGTLNSPDELPEEGEVGWGYVVGSDLWVWTDANGWINVGPIRGPKGDPGEPGVSEWDEIKNKPETFPPDPHTHSWDEISGKPNEFKPEKHTHVLEDISDLQTLVDEIDEAKSVAEAASTKADSAVSTAQEAQDAANNAVATANAAKSTAENAESTATSAQSAAQNAQSVAQSAQSTASSVQSALSSHTSNAQIHRRITYGTENPSGGQDGDIYLQYE